MMEHGDEAPVGFKSMLAQIEQFGSIQDSFPFLRK